MMKTIFTKTYDGESLYDLSRDIADAFDPTFNETINEIPTDEFGIQLGTFTVKIEWSEDE
jgi:hypothetical protein